ncbi:uncharacterized protein RHIMIDRAFT_242547 [Rhizopus microsporus ATCC 52813]|uniref:Phosphatidate phosphatase APP1 catalytic domain-containing protein n=1 Tax=Rhizopus microsporus ATCC 52813 TaxID=1340429 RepID=A0A2G4SFN1_RHIZD|nr:uncharacterized protein RHIMIDRAFT_242547 [Rhizopus microsporus ATCC 52813]PHZ07572.1 hypothetical protein RHIMIDRAFT_242547 [Rhizopus microsporus ATCC 52813]
MNPSANPPMRKRDRLRSFATATTQVIKQEINKYYQPNLVPSRSVGSVPRTDTQDIDDILNTTSVDTVQAQCLIFPTYAYQDDHGWKIHLCGWTFAKPSSGRLDRFLLAAGRTYGGFAKDSQEDFHFSSLLNQFRCQTMRMLDLKLNVPLLKEKLKDILINSGSTGRFEQEVIVNREWIKNSREGLNVEAWLDDNQTCFTGFVDLVEPSGISVISDIDDTIKVTDILDGRDAILQNTFFRTAREVPHMNEVYRAWAAEGAHFHYVSNSPWQIYPALMDFINDKQFPKGSMHLRTVSTQDLIMGRPGKHKLTVISKILRDFPNRKFILVGDSGEIDPEIYQQIYNEFPDQIIKIFIHDVSSQRAINADRRLSSASVMDSSYYSAIRKFISRESALLRKKDSSAQLAMDVMATTEIPQEQQQMTDPQVPLVTKLEQFQQRMDRVSSNMREGVFTVFSLASQLMLDPVIAEEFLMNKK